MATESVIVKPPRKRRRYWHWLIFVALLITLFTWWNWPRYYRLRDMAARLDRDEPGWRFDDYHQSKPNLPDAQNGAQYLLSIEGSLPTSLSGLYLSVSSKLNIVQTDNWEDGRHLLTQEPLAEEYTEVLQRTRVLRERLPALLQYAESQVLWPKFKDMRFNAARIPYPRLTDWWVLLVLHWEEALRGEDVSEMERRTRLLFHFLHHHYADTYFGLPQYTQDFCFLATRLERLLAQHHASDSFLMDMEARLRNWNWDILEEQVLKHRRAIHYEMANMFLNEWEQTYAFAKQRGEPWHSLWHASFTRDDLIEGHTLSVEYHQLRLLLLRGDLAASAELDQFLARIKQFKPDQNEMTLARLIKQFQQSGRITAYHQCEVYEREHDQIKEAKAMQRMLLAALAIERYRRRTGKLPATWNELIPAYMKEAPQDPFKPGQSISLITTASGIRLETSQRDSNGTQKREGIFQVLHRTR